MNPWIRVSKAEPCRICRKPDWCTWHPEVGACCMRVESDRPLHNGGWLHPIAARPSPALRRAVPEPEPTINSTALARRWLSQTSPERMDHFAELLGVSRRSLEALYCAWAQPHHAWAFPMRDSRGNAIGIRLRSETGAKWAVKGSHQGLFIPAVDPQPTAYVCEGPTDTAAAVTLGLFAVGRPSCSGCLGETVSYLRRSHVERVVVVTDNDTPGITGANQLVRHLPVPGIVVLCPAKDLRQFMACGGTAKLLESLTTSAVWSVPGTAADATAEDLSPGYPLTRSSRVVNKKLSTP